MKKKILGVVIVTLLLVETAMASTYGNVLNSDDKVDAIASASTSRGKEPAQTVFNTKEAKLDKQRDIVRVLYSREQLENLQLVGQELEKAYENIKVLPIENVLTKNTNFKFDVPVVIKEGRTLIPIRTISEGLDAKVAWDGEKQKVTITRENTIIELIIGDNIAYVNGVATEIDVPAEVMSKRTMVPLRFVIESMDLGIEWDAETETIEFIY